MASLTIKIVRCVQFHVVLTEIRDAVVIEVIPENKRIGIGIEHEERFFHFKASEVMTKNPRVVESGTLASQALQKMEKYHVVAMPVIDENKNLIGVVHLHDILDKGIRD